MVSNGTISSFLLLIGLDQPGFYQRVRLAHLLPVGERQTFLQMCDAFLFPSAATFDVSLCFSSRRKVALTLLALEDDSPGA